MIADLNQWMLEMGVAFKVLNPAANKPTTDLKSTQKLQEALDKV
jgi:hypothetical protein